MSRVESPVEFHRDIGWGREELHTRSVTVITDDLASEYKEASHILCIRAFLSCLVKEAADVYGGREELLELFGDCLLEEAPKK